MKKTNKIVLYVMLITLTIVFSAVICYILSQNDVPDIPYIYLEF